MNDSQQPPRKRAKYPDIPKLTHVEDPKVEDQKVEVNYPQIPVLRKTITQESFTIARKQNCYHPSFSI